MTGLADRLVAIGASAGGIAALRRVLPGLEGMGRGAAVVVLHLPPECETSRLKLNLREAEEGQGVLAGGRYLAPPNYHLLIERERTFALNADPPVRCARPSIDVLLESAARAYQEHCLGVILTGANDDGARGCQAVNCWHGQVLVQDPAEAEINSMPRAVLTLCPQARIFTLAALAEHFQQLVAEGSL